MHRLCAGAGQGGSQGLACRPLNISNSGGGPGRLIPGHATPKTTLSMIMILLRVVTAYFLHFNTEDKIHYDT